MADGNPEGTQNTGATIGAASVGHVFLPLILLTPLVFTIGQGIKKVRMFTMFIIFLLVITIPPQGNMNIFLNLFRE